ncbi:MAG: hypothetical protein WAW06_05680, partial [bacterium]
MARWLGLAMVAALAAVLVGAAAATAGDVTVKGLVQTQLIMQQHQQSTFVARAIRLTGSSKMTDKISALITLEA